MVTGHDSTMNTRKRYNKAHDSIHPLQTTDKISRLKMHRRVGADNPLSRFLLLQKIST